MKIRDYIFATSAAVGAVFLIGSWISVGATFDTVFRDQSRAQSGELARVAFATMYEIMSKGWDREQAEAFLAGLRESSSKDGFGVEIYRGPLVEESYGAIAQPAMGANVREAFASGERVIDLYRGGYRNTFPLVAEDRCLRCHRNAAAGDVLGVIEIVQPYEAPLQQARVAFYGSSVPSLLLGMLVAMAAVWLVGRRISRAVGDVEESLDSINNLADLRQLEVVRHDLGFDELERIESSITALAGRLRSIAVDKDILMFEIGLLEKFVITSEVIRDWREYVTQLLQDINTILHAPVLFSIFQIDDELFDVEIFWHREPTDTGRKHIEDAVSATLKDDARFNSAVALNVHHHFPSGGKGDAGAPDGEALALQIKSFFVDKPKIGSIVGIGVRSDTLAEPTQNLVLDSILSTLLNVVGSIKAIHKYTRDLEYYATRDPLTDLYNQRVFWELLNYEVHRCSRHNTKSTLLMIDLDNFKLINDHFGHAVGDQFLQNFARAIQSALRGGDIFARYGGDEFCALLPETGLEQGYAVAKRVLEATRNVVVDAGEQGKATASASIGLAVYPDHATEAKDMFLFADTLMYKAKSEGKERVALPTEEDVMAAFRNISDMGVAVMNAINERKIIPFFQPIMHVTGDRPDAVEVLSRIEVNGELMRADQFIEVAEKMGIIHRLDALVIEAALQKVVDSSFDGYIFFNLSPRALVLSEFTRTLRTVVKHSGIAPERIVFEITERDTVKNLSVLERFFSDLKSEGFGLAIDDFGSGFSSFHYLRRFPFDFLKIEGDFIANMLNSDRDRIFVRSINDLARALKIQVIAEFVESEEVLDMIRALRIDYAQGYHVGRPARTLPALRDALEPMQR
ncbi:MAG TPA: bifunctional diguanylate cyclase/phosphodiesterase [Rhodocyclaceae bacterium]|nr:bifunctional diguanylate cyclase/phosphodiesterase [Rhodocyclaceae bacterium]